MVPFFSLLDTIPCNAVTMYEIKHGKPHGKISAFNIGWDLVMSLVKPFTEVKPAVRLQIGLRSKVFVIIGRNNNESVEAEAYEYPRFGETKQQCNICLFHIQDKIKRKRRTI